MEAILTEYDLAELIPRFDGESNYVLLVFYTNVDWTI